MNNTIIAVDDDPYFLESIRRCLVAAGFRNLIIESDPLKAAAMFVRQENSFDVAFLDVTMPQLNGEELLETIRHTSPDTECIMVTGLNDSQLAIRCMRKGAYDYLLKPTQPEVLVSCLKRALERKRLLGVLEINKRSVGASFRNPDAFKPILTKSNKMIRLLREAELHAASLVPVLITGESGTGKELLARAIHQASGRARHAFTPVNIASLNRNLFDSEFLGHTKGAFTGATHERRGYLEETHKGTLFMDEIGDIPLEFQVKLLRILQEREFVKLGTNRPVKVDVRFVAATNADLEELLRKEIIRQDFYYRLRGAWLHIPPLRKRKEDIPLICQKFLGDVASGEDSLVIDDDAMEFLLGYNYPGNVRELQSIIQTSVNLARNNTITFASLPEYIKQEFSPARGLEKTSSVEDVRPLCEVEKEHILNVYHSTKNNKSKTARLLQIGLNTLRRKLKSYGVYQ